MKELDIDSFEDYSNTLVTTYSKVFKCNIKEFKDCTNNGIIIKGSFYRLLSHLQAKDFMILSAYNSSWTKEKNIQRNRDVRKILNESRLGVYQLVGHTKAITDSEEREIYTAEKAYLVHRPDNLELDEFLNIIVKCLQKVNTYNESAVFRSKEDICYVIDSSGILSKIGQSLDETAISHTYSKFIRKDTSDFIFDGVEFPGSNSGRWLYTQNHILY